ERRLHRGHVGAPALALACELGGAFPREAVDAPLARTLSSRPTAGQQTPALEPVQRRIDGSLGELERAATSVTDSLAHRVPVGRPGLERREEQQIDVSLQYLGLHSLILHGPAKSGHVPESVLTVRGVRHLELSTPFRARCVSIRPQGAPADGVWFALAAIV